MALNRLRDQRATLSEGENALNARLFDELRRAKRLLKKSDPCHFVEPRSECPVQPYGVTDESHRRLKATPDITWGYHDTSEPDPLKATRDFVIECKRVRTPTASGWQFTSHYVTDGVLRFCQTDKRYAEGVPSAVMVGYWQNQEADRHLDLVNQELAAAKLPPLKGIVKPCKVSRLRHQGHFQRTFVVSPFNLHHCWIDLR
ncbi:MAG: hypothetical protein LBK60_08945 [Verrucomicrobiales bacterium]|nr:hypothetical protein [Verrucomicrobiales bacterium]